ncbi:MAG TPA: hypothetical protein VJX70_09090 [Candidatus Acidoferrum sp.]|nr:hypothetical protein [Candidatus Acidoferrum sp.]
MPRSIVALVVLPFLLALSGCGSSLHTFGPVVVNVTDPFSAIQVGAPPITLTATVTNDTNNEGVVWQLSVANTGCSPACGTLVTTNAATAIYTPPATAPLNTNATITAISKIARTQVFVFNFSIIPGISVSITNKFSSIVASGSSVTVTAQVENDLSGGGVSWALTAGGSACSPACGTLVPSVATPVLAATYTPPPTLPTGANASPTITATSLTKSSASDSFSFQIVSANALLKGSYTFLVRGYDLTGSPMALAGSFTADGNGAITGGELDSNNNGGITAVPNPITGTYTVDLSFNSVPHASVALTSDTVPGTLDYPGFSFVLSSDGKRGRIIELDGIGFINVGSIQLQDSAALTAANPAGTYVFGLSSDAPVGGRTVAAGQLILASTGVTGGLLDESKAADATPRYVATPLAASSATTPDALGRGTLTLKVNANGATPASSRNFVYYLVDSTQLNLIEVDPVPDFGTVHAGVARVQKTLTGSSVNANSVIQLTGMDAVPGTPNGIGPDIIIGSIAITAGNSFQITFDTNDLGNLKVTVSGPGKVTFDPTTGRGQLSASSGFQSGFMNVATFYLDDSGEGFVIDGDISTTDPNTPPDQIVTNNAFSGTLIRKSTTAFSAQTLSGNVLYASGGTVIPQIPALSAALNINSSAGTYTAFGDLASLNSQDGNAPNVNFSGALQLIDPGLGHGLFTFPQQVFGVFNNQTLSYRASFYLVGPNQFVAMGIQGSVYTGVITGDPQ